MARYGLGASSFGGGGGGGGGYGGSGGRGALVARESRCELSFCAMPLPSILKRASSYILGESCRDSLRAMYQDGETLFCKNNVCVHPPALLRQHCDVVHHPGYMTVVCRVDGATGAPTLHLSWIPNSTLRKHPSTLENTATAQRTRQRPRQPPDGGEGGGAAVAREKEGQEDEPRSVEPGRTRIPENVDVCLEAKEPVDCKDCERVCSSSATRILIADDSSAFTSSSTVVDCQPASSCANGGPPGASTQAAASPHDRPEPGIRPAQRNEQQQEQQEQQQQQQGVQIVRSQSVDSRIEENVGCKDAGVIRDDVSVKSRSMSLTSTCSLSIIIATDDEIPAWLRTPELLALQHNLTFPDSATGSPVAMRRTPAGGPHQHHHQGRCRRFSVDLGQMRSLRLFFADPECTSGQLVVASRESQYKILHFHHGGLDRLAATLHQWHQLLNPGSSTDAEDSSPYRHFMVCRPVVGSDELHPEEGRVPMITSLAWRDLLNERGQVEDDLGLRRGVFFGGLEPALRKIVWPFLLHCYSYQSTWEDRERIDAIRREEYAEIRARRETLRPEDADRFWRNVVCIVEKDVVRTDRANPYYAGEDNPNIEIMKNILLNYAVYNARLGYTQGMSDLLSPLLAELDDEEAAFWCFAGLMQRSVAVCTPTDVDMDRNLSYLRELLRVMVPDFYAHLQRHTDALELLFCHRWILLCLKREFPMDVALTMWEACWVNYLTDHFHLFLCLAVMAVYAEDAIAQDLRTDEMLLHFSSLAMYMDGGLILRKARGLLHQFRQLDRLPCSLAGLCRQCGPGQWDSAHDPVIECVGGHGDGPRRRRTMGEDDDGNGREDVDDDDDAEVGAAGDQQQCPHARASYP